MAEKAELDKTAWAEAVAVHVAEATASGEPGQRARSRSPREFGAPRAVELCGRLCEVERAASVKIKWKIKCS